MAEGVGFEPTCLRGKRFSRPPRYDRFDNPPYEIVIKKESMKIDSFIISHYIPNVNRVFEKNQSKPSAFMTSGKVR